MWTRVLAGVVIATGVGKFALDFATDIDRAFRPILPSGKFAAARCGFENKSGRPVRCGWLSVSRDPFIGGDPRYRLWVTIFGAAAHGRGKAPVIFLPGGPGGAGFARNWTQIDLRLPGINGRAFIVMDPRGTGKSQPDLSCPLPRAHIAKSAAMARAVRHCTAHLERKGHPLRLLSTPVFAADFIALRKALGIRKWVLLGVSYGTRLGLELIGRDGDAVEKAIMVGPLPLDTTSYEPPAVALKRALMRLEKACRITPKCADRGHRPWRSFFAAVEKYRHAGDLDGGADRRSDEVVLGNDRPAGSYSRVARIAFFHFFGAADTVDASAFLGDLARNHDPAKLRKLTATIDAFEESVTPAILWTVTCSELDRKVMAASTGRASRLASRFAPLMSGLSEVETCAMWRVIQKYPIRPAKTRGDTQVLVLAGMFDTSTPPDHAVAFVRGLKNAKIYYPPRGHQALSGLCPQGVISGFLQGRLTPDGGRCTNTILPAISRNR